MNLTEVCAELRQLAEAKGWRSIELTVLVDGRCRLTAYTPKGFVGASVPCDVEADSTDPSPDVALARLRGLT